MTIVQFKGIKEAPKSVSSQMDTLLITPDLIELPSPAWAAE